MGGAHAPTRVRAVRRARQRRRLADLAGGRAGRPGARRRRARDAGVLVPVRRPGRVRRTVRGGHGPAASSCSGGTRTAARTTSCSRSRRRTIAHALADSPVGPAGVERAAARRRCDPDFVLTNVSIYWFTNTAGSAARLYYEDRHAPTAPEGPTTVPLGLANFKHDFQSVRRFAERDHANIVSWRYHDEGSHYSALDAPDTLVADICESSSVPSGERSSGERRGDARERARSPTAEPGDARPPVPPARARRTPPLAVAEHLVGLQAQTPHTWYVGLWCARRRVPAGGRGRPAHLAAGGADRADAVDDPLRQRGRRAGAAPARAAGARPGPVPQQHARALDARSGHRRGGGGGARAVGGTSRCTPAELGAALLGRWPDNDPAALAYAVRNLLPVVQIAAARGVGTQRSHRSTRRWTDGSARRSAAVSLETLVLRYLAAYGPATVQDIQTWCGLTRLGEVVDGLRPRLVEFADGYLDLPDAPRPDQRASVHDLDRCCRTAIQMPRSTIRPDLGPAATLQPLLRTRHQRAQPGLGQRRLAPSAARASACRPARLRP